MALFIKIGTNHKPEFKFICKNLKETLFVNKDIYVQVYDIWNGIYKKNSPKYNIKQLNE